MNSLDEHLIDEQARIIKLLTPPFFDGKLQPGFIKGYLRGIRENGGQYTHAATWVVIANAIMGRGDRAFELFQMLNPITHTSSPSGVRTYMGEPYALCGDVYGVDPHKGRAGWSWYTGSSSWLYQAGINHIMGIKLAGNFLKISPSVPKSWSDFSIKLSLKNEIKINYKNPQGVESGIKSITVNGDMIDGDTIDLDRYSDIDKLNVTVIMG